MTAQSRPLVATRRVGQFRRASPEPVGMPKCADRSAVERAPIARRASRATRVWKTGPIEMCHGSDNDCRGYTVRLPVESRFEVLHECREHGSSETIMPGEIERREQYANLQQYVQRLGSLGQSRIDRWAGARISPKSINAARAQRRPKRRDPRRHVHETVQRPALRTSSAENSLALFLMSATIPKSDIFYYWTCI
jgi:hypothetical protein